MLKVCTNRSNMLHGTSNEMILFIICLNGFLGLLRFPLQIYHYWIP